ncbi:HAD-IA family hydrolase [Pelagibacterium xiamenense]|uniref:HAD-IA family hydrolase n=1 Tax=Pelagibacterium xiamenense TaxID=2901140 RepID=UPI001E4B8B55|nr:HAD-IA family hydrolase [Pelagibacterium xiamenense]MCD7061199.1 HAD-IA family hydrolase [Pelagibacterium xiamenense]
MSDPRLIMFDMDGTLIDSGSIIAEHMASTFLSHGLDVPTREMSNSVIGLSLEVAMMNLAKCDPETGAAMAETYRGHYRAMLAEGGRHEPLYAGAMEAVLALKAQEASLLGIATGKGLQGVNRILALHGMADHFVTLQTPDHNPSKPHPGMVLRACAETGIHPERTVMIGDTTFDMELGRAAGAKTIGVTWGYHARVALEGAGADMIVTNYDDLNEAIDEVLA